MLLDLQNLLSNCSSHKLNDWKLKIISDWPSIIGNLHQHARVERVYEDLLVLGVYDTCWMQELHLLSNMIIKKVNSHLDTPHIKQIRLKYVQKHDFRNISKSLADRTVEALPMSKPESNALQQIVDPELRDAIQNFLSRCSRENQ